MFSRGLYPIMELMEQFHIGSQPQVVIGGQIEQAVPRTDNPFAVMLSGRQFSQVARDFQSIQLFRIFLIYCSHSGISPTILRILDVRKVSSSGSMMKGGMV